MQDTSNTVAVFDFDKTLIANDAMYSWSKELVKHGWVDKNTFIQRELEYYDEYVAGTLNIAEYALNHFDIISRIAPAQLNEALDHHFNKVLEPQFYKEGLEHIADFKKNNVPVAIISASPDFIIRHAAQRLGVPYSFGSGLWYENGRYLDQLNPIQPFKEGKVTCFNQWVEDLNLSPTTSYFYSDSHTDSPLLEFVSHPVIIHPDKTLKAIAEQKSWPIAYWQLSND